MLSPEQNQKLLDLRQRMLANVQAGLPPQHDIGEDEIREGLSFVRQNRAIPASSRTPPKKKAGAKPKVEIDTSAFTSLDLD
jgi:hypothetical protein